MFAYKILHAKKFNFEKWHKLLQVIHRETNRDSESASEEETFFLLATKALDESAERLQEGEISGQDLGEYLNFCISKYRR